MSSSVSSSKPKSGAPSTTVRASKYTFVGIILTVFNFGLYTLIARIIGNNEFLWLATLIATSATTILAYFLHSKITWKERTPNKTSIIKFFIWNALGAIAIGPFLTWVFTALTPLYDFAFNLSTAIHLPFDYDFIQSTGVFILTSAVCMILNYLFYDKFVFGKSHPDQADSK